MPAASAEMATATSEPSTSTSTPRKALAAPEKKYKCQFCNRAFSRSEHRSRHERSRKFCCSSLPLFSPGSRAEETTHLAAQQIYSIDIHQQLLTVRRRYQGAPFQVHE